MIPFNLQIVNGANTGIVPPVPIPNTEVKYAEADDSRKAKVGKRRSLVTT